MQKQYIIIFYLLTATFGATAQLTPAKAKPKPVTDSVAKAMCSCIMNNKDSLVTLNNLYKILNYCTIENSADHIIQELLNEDGFIQTDDRKTRAEATRAVGKKLGQRVSAECSGLKAIIDGLTAKENKKKE